MFMYHTAARPCPICAGTSDCRTNDKGGVHCRRGDQNSPPAGWRCGGEDRQGFGMYWPSDDNGAGDWADKRIEEIKAKVANRKANASAAAEVKSQKELDEEFDEIKRAKKFADAANARDMTEAERLWLANRLCLPTQIFDLVPVKFLEDDGSGRGGAYVTPEKDGHGNVTGYQLRYFDNQKRTYGPRGLFTVENWAADDPDLIVIPEGMSDTLALIACGIASFGRPSNMTGAEQAAVLLRSMDFATNESKMIVILGENDRRESGLWPGRDGAERTATRLSELIGRPVYVAYPLVHKDVREFITAHKTELIAKSKSLRELGYEFTEHIRATAIPFGDRRNSEVISTIFGFELDGVTPIPPLSALSEYKVDLKEIVGMDQVAVDRFERAIPKYCESCRGVILRECGTARTRFLWADCKKLSCEYCEPLKRSQYKATISERLMQWEAKNPDRLLYLYYCDSRKWRSASNWIRRANGLFFRLDIADGRLAILSTCPPMAALTASSRTITPVDAVEELCRMVDFIPKFQKGVWSSSNEWRLVGEDDKTPSNWEIVSAFKTSREKVVDILDYTKVDWKPVGKTGRFWSWTAFQMDHGGVNVEHVYQQVMIGEAMPEFDFDDNYTTTDPYQDSPTPSGMWAGSGAFIDW